MMPIVVLLALGAAALHATWNVLVRGSNDQLWSVTVMSFATTLVALPFGLILPFPELACLPYLLASAVVQLGSILLLAYAYRHGGIGQVYPMVRGCVPVLVTIGGYAFAHQHLAAPALIGIALISGGIVGVVVGRDRLAPTPIAFAVATAVSIATYQTIDSLGVRRTHGALAYAAWIFILYGAAMPLAFRLIRGNWPRRIFDRNGRIAMGGGIVSLVSYGAVVSAFALGPVAPISALRETSIVFSAFFGRLLLGERLTGRRILVCAAVTAGAAAIALG